MTNYRDRFQNTNSTNLGAVASGLDEERKRKLFSAKGFKVLSPQDDSLYLTEAESERFVKAFIKQKTRYIPEIDYKDPSTFAFFGSAERYYEDAIKNIYNTYPYDGSKAEKMEWSVSASYIDLYILEHEYPKSAGHVIFDRSSDSITDDTHYPTTDNIQYIKFSGGPQINTIYNSSKNREGNLKLNGTTGNTFEFWLKKDSSSWYSNTGRKEVIFDICASVTSSTDQRGRFTVELENPASSSDSPILFTYLSGTTGATQLRLGSSDVTKSTVADGEWHHYAITAITTGSSTEYKLYVDGTMNYSTVQAHTLEAVDRPMTGTIGSLSSQTYAGHGALGTGKLSGSLDEVRFWKKARTEKEIGRFWYQPIHGGTDADHTNASLGLYYKFNEGVTSVTRHDKVVLDYSGRINNGEVVGLSSGFRSTASGIESSNNLPESNFSEVKDPIINPSNSLVTSKLESLKKIGKSHDLQNQASLLNTVPDHFRTQDTNLFPKLLQILSSTFDDLFLKIKNLPEMKSFSYNDFFKESGYYRKAQDNNFLLGCEDTSLVEFTGNNFKPWTKDIIEHYGLVSTDIFSDATIFENFFNRSEQLTFEHNLEEVKRAILSNIHKNLVYILKAKGTESSFRNIIRCFGVDEELIKLNVYGQNEEYKLEEKPIYTSLKKKALSFEKENFQGTVYQVTDGPYSTNYITGSSTITPFTLEANILFPRQNEDTSPKLVEASLFGMHSVSGSEDPAQPLCYHAEDSGSFQVYFKKRTRTSRDGYFVLTSSAGVITAVNSSYIPSVYDNEHWNIALSIGAKSDIDFNVVPATSDTQYLVELRGYNYDLDVLKDSFHISASLSREDYVKISEQNKAVFLGSHKTHFSGTHLMSSDVRVLGFNVWRDILSDEEHKEHAKNPETYGRKKPHTVSNFDTGINLQAKDSLILRWQFQNLTASSDSTYTMDVADFTSGSAAAIETDSIVGYKYAGRGQNFPNTDAAIVQEFIPSVQYAGIDNVYSSNRIKVKNYELDKFEPDSRPVTYFYSFEKSMYQVVSKEMVNFFAGIVGYNNLIGEPVNKYRSSYKAMEKVREKFFANVSNDLDLEKFVEFYRWIDSSLSNFLNQMTPASANFGSGIKDVVESHILERNKYKHQPPTIEFKDPADKTYPIMGVNELLYDWEHGHYSSNEDEHCLWQRERSPRTGDRETLRRISITEVSGSTYALRRLTKPYKLSGNNSLIVGTGLNKKANKNTELYKVINSGKEIHLTSSAVLTQKVCNDVLDPNAKTFIKSKIDVSSTEGYLDVDSDMALPFTMVSSSAGNSLTTLKQDLQVSNNHLPIGQTGEVPLQGPFTSTHIGSMPHRRVSLGTLDKDRPEAYSIGIETSSVSTFVDIPSKAIRFVNDSSSYIEIDHSTSFHMSDGNSFGDSNIPFAISFWVYPDSAGMSEATVYDSDTAGMHDILVKGENYLNYEFAVGIGRQKTGGAMRPYLELKGTPGNARSTVEYGRPLNNEQWNHVVVTYNAQYSSAAKIDIYVNNGTQASYTGGIGYFGGFGNSLIENWIENSDQILQTTGSVKIGMDFGYISHRKFVGQLADIIIFKNAYLNSTHVSELYAGGKILNNLATGSSAYSDVLAWYKMGESPDDNSTSNGIKDSVGSFHGTAKDSTLVTIENASGSLLMDNQSVSVAVTQITGSVVMQAPSSDVPKSQFYNHIEAASHANIRNIKHDTGSLVLGNYNKVHEIVRTNGRMSNNSHFVETEGSYVNQTPSSSAVTGFVDSGKPNRSRSGHVIVNKFSAPGGPETAGYFANDIESGEMSVYNTINYRNLNKRNLLSRLYSEASERSGYRTGSAVQGSLHKTYRNPLRQTGALNQEVEFDNFFISHQIPTNDFSYSWITASANESVYSFLNKNENIGHQHLLGKIGTSTLRLTSSSETISFLSSSELVTNLDFAQMNFYATSSLAASTSTLSYVNTALNSQILNLQGPYGWPTWKQLRGQEHPIVRDQKKNNKFTISVRKQYDAYNRLTESVFPSTYNVYRWSSNKDLSNVDDKRTITEDKKIKVYDEVMVTNRFNPLTITLHGSRARDLTTKTIPQHTHNALWTNDETSLVSLEEQSAQILGQAPNTRLTSLKTTYGNKLTLFANTNLTNKLSLDDVYKRNSEAHTTLNAAGTVSRNNPNVFSSEVSYIETLYPREINTFSKSSKVRELFDFYSWRSSRNSRNVTLGGKITYGSSAIKSGSFGILPVSTISDRYDYKTATGFLLDATDATTVTGSAKSVRHIKTSRWPLDARSNFADSPISLTASYYELGNSYFLGRNRLGTMNEGILQNDYNTFVLGYNSLHVTPPPAPLYNRRIPQFFPQQSLAVRGDIPYNAFALTSSLSTIGSVTSTESTPDYDFGTTSAPFSISFWFKETKQLDTGFLPLVAFHEASDYTDTQYRVYRYLNSGYERMYFEIRGNSGGYINVFTTYTTDFDADAWYNVVATFDGTTSYTGMNLYINGNSLSQFQSYGGTYGTRPQSISSKMLSVMNPPASAGVTSSGNNVLMADVAIFDVELSQAEVTELYNSGTIEDLQGHSRYANAVLNLKMGDGTNETETTTRDYIGSIDFDLTNIEKVPATGLTSEKQIFETNVDTTQEFLSGEAEWLAPSQSGLNPFVDNVDSHTDKVKYLGQDHSLVPEFKISDHVEYILTQEDGNFYKTSVRPDWLSLTGAIYHSSSNQVQIASNFYKTYATSDFMKYFNIVRREVKSAGMGDASKITLKCNAVMKFVPYKGFYPAERTVQISEIFSRGYLPNPIIELEDGSSAFINSSIGGIKGKIRANMQQSMKPLLSPGILYNSIKCGLAVDYPLFGADSMLTTLETYKSGSRDTSIENLSSFPSSLSSLTNMTGSLVNSTVDTGIPRLSGSVYRRVTFEDLLDPDSLIGVNMYDQEPHPSASMYIADSMATRVLDYPPKFGQLDSDNNSTDLLVKKYRPKNPLSETLKPYKMAVQNFCAETVEFFLKDSKLSTIESQEVFPYLELNKEYKMRVYLRNNGLRMYDRHSAFGPPVDESGTSGIDFKSLTTTSIDIPAEAASVTISSLMADDGGHILFSNWSAKTYNETTASAYSDLPHFSITASNGQIARINMYGFGDFEPWTYHSKTESNMKLDHGDLGFGFGLDPGDLRIYHHSSSGGINIYVDLNSTLSYTYGPGASQLVRAIYLGLYYYSNEWYGYFPVRVSAPSTVSSTEPYELVITQTSTGTSGNTPTNPNNDSDNWVVTPSSFSGGQAASTETRPTVIIENLKNTHAHSPFVPPFLDVNSEPYVEISFTPTSATGGSKEYTLPEILANSTYTYVNFAEPPSNAADNSNYLHAMALSASLDLDKIVVYDANESEPASERNQRLRWAIQTKWETPVLNFINTTGSALNLSSGLVESVSGSSPWQKREWSNFYNSSSFEPNDITYLTSSLGMWHQYGALPTGDKEGYVLSVERTPNHPSSQQLSEILGFHEKGQKAEVTLGRLSDRKTVSEAVVAIPFVETNDIKSPIIFFQIKQDLFRKAAKLNKDKREEYFEAVLNLDRNINSPERNRFLREKEEYDRFYNSPGQAPVESVAYQMRMMDKFILPPQFDYVNNVENKQKPMMYIFQFHAEFDKYDLSNMWQNLPPVSSNSCANPRVPSSGDASELGSKISDVQYVSNFFDNSNQSLCPFNSDNFFQNRRVRWLIFKVKQRAEFDLYSVKKKSLEGVSRFGKSVNTSFSNFNPTPFLRNQKYSYNWPYDFFSIVELIKMESKVDFFSNARVIVEPEEE